MSANVLEEIRRRLVEALHPDKIVLFGSRARNDATEESDYDVMVVGESDLDATDRMTVAHLALCGLGAPCDVFWYTPEEFEAHRTWLSDIAGIASREGVVMYDATAR